MVDHCPPFLPRSPEFPRSFRSALQKGHRAHETRSRGPGTGTGAHLNVKDFNDFADRDGLRIIGVNER
jgi:hypothetical protein